MADIVGTCTTVSLEIPANVKAICPWIDCIIISADGSFVVRVTEPRLLARIALDGEPRYIAADNGVALGLAVAELVEFALVTEPQLMALTGGAPMRSQPRYAKDGGTGDTGWRLPLAGRSTPSSDRYSAVARRRADSRDLEEDDFPDDGGIFGANGADAALDRAERRMADANRRVCITCASERDHLPAEIDGISYMACRECSTVQPRHG